MTPSRRKQARVIQAWADDLVNRLLHDTKPIDGTFICTVDTRGTSTSYAPAPIFIVDSSRLGNTPLG